ncbi:MAG: glycosyl transferase family 2 [uncultured bacterium]|nr:MAG: glycosyl transferase family 2 [uncultured bacterium]
MDISSYQHAKLQLAMAVKLSIIIPCYNERENLDRGVLNEIYSYLKTVPYSWEVIISNDASSDTSSQFVSSYIKDKPLFSLLNNPHGGKAKAVWAGIQAAKGDIILFTDMDQSTPLSEVAKLLPWYDKDYDVVFGSRGSVRANFPWYRQLMSAGFRIFRQLFLLKDIEDTQCGFKSFRRQVALEIFPKLEVIGRTTTTKGWSVSAFDVELLFLAEKLGYRLKEVDVSWQDRDVTTGKSKNFIKESKDMLKQILRVKLNDLYGRYG